MNQNSYQSIYANQTSNGKKRKIRLFFEKNNDKMGLEKFGSDVFWKKIVFGYHVF